MQKENHSQAQAQKEQTQLMTFQFSESKQPIRNLLIEAKPWFVAKDVCDILELKDTNMSIKTLDDDEKLTQKILGSGQNRKMWLISESGLYALVLRSSKPQAKLFRKWITAEVIPSLLKHGYYWMNRTNVKGDYFDARDVPFFTKSMNDYNVRWIELNGEKWVVINDITTAIHARTDSRQIAKKLNAKQTLAQKIWLYGNTHPAWCANELGVKLLLAGSRTLRVANQLKLNV